jgi:hypothetical protein
MKPSTHQCIGEERLASANASTMVEATIPKGTSAVQIAVETTSCRSTAAATGDPTSSVGLIIQKDQMPWFMPVGQGCTLRFASTAGTQSVIQVRYLQ